MKSTYAAGLIAAAVLVTVAIEESRIASLRAEAKPRGNAVAVSAASGNPVSNSADSGPPRTKGRSEIKPAGPAKAGNSDEESFAKSVRKMWDNPAGKSMMTQGVKVAVAMMYQDFIDGLKLTKEETEYLKTLLGKDMAGQQEIGMKMMNASPDERKALTDEITSRNKENDEEIKKFLNSDEDYKRYTEYKDRLPEHQQLDGIRTAMETKGAPLDADTEAKLVDVMYKARTESKSPDLSGPGAMEQMAKGNLADSYEKNWQAQQDSLHAATSGILNSTQMEAFQEYQKQMKDMQLMGLKMAEKMMNGNKEGAQ